MITANHVQTVYSITHPVLENRVFRAQIVINGPTMIRAMNRAPNRMIAVHDISAFTFYLL
jgi:hypothetical protein